MSSTLDAALDMARRGFRVFPCIPYGKKPAIDDWTALATSDEAQIRAWFEYRSDYNYGVLTNDYVVPDIDIAKVGREAALANYAALGGHWDTLVVQTPTGGYHAYYAGPDSALRVGMLPGIDIRSHNGYVVGPGCYTDPVRSQDPSVKATGWYSLVSDASLAWVPFEIEKRLRPPGSRIERDEFSVELDTPTAISNAQVWLSAAPPAVEGQGGDNHTYQVAAKLVREFALTPETAFAIMQEWNDRCVPPWEVNELWTKIQNAANYGQGALGSARPEATFGVVNVPPQQWEVPAQEHGVYMGNPLAAVDVKARPWLVERLLMRGDVTMLAAAGAGGKSIIELTLAAHWAVGQDFGPYKLKSPGMPQKLFIYNAEDDIEEQTRRLLAICATYKLDYEKVRANLMLMDDSLGELVVATATHNVPSENVQVVQFLIKTIQDFGVTISVFDPIVNMHHCSENDNPQMRFLISVFRRIARITNTAVLLAHHTSKGAVKGERGDADNVRGAGSLINSCRVAVMISGPEDSDLAPLGIDKTQRHSYVRLDDAKANMFARSGKPIMWLQWESVRIMSGDMIGVPVGIDVDTAKRAEEKRLIETIHTNMITAGTATCTLADAVRYLRAEDELWNKMCEENNVGLRRLIEKSLVQPYQIGPNEQLVLVGTKGAPLIKIL